MHTLHICLLGDFRLIYGDDLLTTINTPRLQALFTYLLLHRQAPQVRQHVAFQFWPDSSEKQAHTNLRKLLFQLRNALPHPDHFLVQDHLSVQWRPDAPYTLDVGELTHLLTLVGSNGKATANAHYSAHHDELARVANLYQGELLPSCFDEWILPVRQQLHRDVMQALEQLINLSEHQREYRTGIRYAQRLLGLDPLHEAGYRRLMQLHALNGDRAAAIHNYQTCVTILQQELGVEPDEETRTLYQRLLTMNGEPVQQSAPLVDAPLVGRMSEWQTLLMTWRSAQRGQTHFVSIAGEAGMGKTRLAEELLTWVHAQGVRVARTRSYEAEGGLAYAPVTEWLRADIVKPALKKLEKPWLSEVVRLLPELLTEHPTLAPPAPLTESWQRQRFFEALARAIMAEKTPLLLLIDDLQWCDQETLIWLRFLLRFDPRARLMVIGTWRSEAVDEPHPLHLLLRDLRNANQLTELELTALSAQESVQLIQQISTRPIDNPEMQQLYKVTDGHPLFIIETVRSRGNDSAQSLPLKVQGVIQARLAQLSVEARELAGVAATIGRQFSLAVITHASQSQEEKLVRALDELWQRRIVREQGAGLYDFSHDRIREVAYQALSQTRRKFLHRRVAEVLEVLYGSSLDEVSGLLAEHYLQSDSHTKASYYLQRAGERAAAQYANQSAIEYFSRALALIPHDSHLVRFPLLLARARIANHQGKRLEGKRDLEALEMIVHILDDGTATAARRRAEVALLRSDFGRGIGDNVMIKAAAQEAATLAEQCGASDLAAQANFMWGFADFWEYDFFAQARPRLELALTLAQSTRLHAVEADVRTQLAVYGLYTGDLVAQIEATAQQALAIYQQLGNPAGEAGVLSILSYIIYTQREGDYDRGINYCEQALQIHFDGWDAERFVLGNLGFLWYYQGDYRRAKPLLERQLVIAQEAQNWGAEAGAWMELGCLYMAQGDYATAHLHLGACMKLSRENNARQQYRVKIEGMLALYYHLTGDNTQAHVHAEAAVSFARKLNDPRIQGDAFTRCGRVWVSQDRLAEGAEFFQQALVCFRQMEQWNHTMMPMAGLAEIALRQGDPLQARAGVEEVLVYLQTHQLDRTEEELYVYMTCYRVLKTVNDPHAAALLRLAYEQLEVRASSLETESARTLFWSVPLHSEVLTTMQNPRTTPTTR